VPRGSTFRLPRSMRLARGEGERLWKGLERFVNCEDSESEFQALGRAFPDFWPIEVWHYPSQERARSITGLPDIGLGTATADHASETAWLHWHPVCHKLFLFYRDTLRGVWRGEKQTPDWLGGVPEEFLFGLSNLNDEAREAAKAGPISGPANLSIPYDLYKAWQAILGQSPTATEEDALRIGMLWRYGDFHLVPRNDFQKAFYFLFRQSWRARVCPRCKMFFVARKPKQSFCGTACSAGSRLASKRKWWNSAGARRRKIEVQSRRKREKK